MALNGTMVKIETVTVGSGGAASIDFQNIPQTYTDLMVKMSIRDTKTGSGNTWQAFDVYFNNSTANRSQRVLFGTGSVAGSQSGTEIYGQATEGGSTASTFANGEMYIANYTSSSNKSISLDQVTENNGTAALQYLTAALWSNSAAINRITLKSYDTLFAQHSTATLYGISKVPAVAKAYGGDITFDSQYVYHSFPYSGTFTPLENLTVDYLVIAGGGGGGGATGGGGGAGGYRTTVGTSGGGGAAESALSLTANTNYTVTVGGGGAGGNGTNSNGVSGSNSVFGSITSTGGGGGGAEGTTGNGLSGGSGGGSGIRTNSNATITGGAGTTNQGFKGGDATSIVGVFGAASGGGGAGAAAANTSQSSPTANGGNGLASSITGTSITRAGGGGGSNTGTGGSGGGGNGAIDPSTAATAGTVNTGSGGGGANYRNVLVGGAGGSGIVIVRYAK